MDEQALAHVVVFAYARADHLARTIESLKGNPEAVRTHVTVFCDGPRKPEHFAAVEDVRRLVSRLEGFASVETVLRAENLGLARSIISGVSDTLSRHERVIVVEDDLELSPHFLRYMNDALDRYVDDERIASVHGYCYPVDEVLPETFFLRGADCWGWATWRRAWQHFEPDGRALLQRLQQEKLTHEFDMDGSYPYTRMLQDQINGRNDSWAIRWHASCFLKNMLTLYPGKSLVENIGNDATGTHSIATDVYSGGLVDTPVNVDRIELAESAQARASFVRFLRGQRPAPWKRVIGRFRRILQGALV